MNVMFDIVHPAHVHFFKHMIWGLNERGHATLVVARKKDVTLQLLDCYGLEYECTGESRPRSRLGQLGELLARDLALYKLGRKFDPDLILTRNPAGVQAARSLGVRGVFDTDDGLAAGIHFKAAAPFADVITTPDCLQENYGRKHLKYPGYKQSAYLHPDIFKPDAGVLGMLGVTENEPFYIVRFVSMHASHDKGEAGLSFEVKQQVIDKLLDKGKVFITSEGDLPNEWQHLQASIPPHMIHDALAYATLFVGDSQTMAAEAAVLGTPSIRVSSFAGRISYLEELQHEYHLTFAYRPSEQAEFLDKLKELLAHPDLRAEMSHNHRSVSLDKKNIASWFIEQIESGFKGPLRH